MPEGSDVESDSECESSHHDSPQCELYNQPSSPEIGPDPNVPLIQNSAIDASHSDKSSNKSVDHSNLFDPIHQSRLRDISSKSSPFGCIPCRFMLSCLLLFLFSIWATDIADDIYPAAKDLLEEPVHYIGEFYGQLSDRNHDKKKHRGKKEDDLYSQIINFTIPRYNMNVSGEWFILQMSTYEAQRYSQVNALANSYHLSLFMERHQIPVRAAEVIWSRTIGPWSENHNRALSDPCATVQKEKFPKSFVMKGTHCSGCVVIVNEGKLTKKDCLRKWLKDNPSASTPEVLEQFCRTYLNVSYMYPFADTEWWYRFMPRDVIVENMLRDSTGGVPSDYKIFVFAGEPVYLYITMCRECDPPINQVYHVAEGRWELTKYHYKDRQSSEKVMDMPRCWPHMVKISKMISFGIPFVRTDFYDLGFDNKPCEENVILGEMTFRPHGGNIASNYDDEFNQIMGNNAIYRYLDQYPCKHNIEFDISNLDLILFDLDDCIWSGDVQFTDTLEYTFHHGNETIGSAYEIQLYTNVRPFMRCLKNQKPTIKLAVASHGPKPDRSREALKLFRLLDDLLDHKLLFFRAAETSDEKSKMWHFEQVRKKSKIPYERMAFFDNSRKYIDEAESLGMKGLHVKRGFGDLWPDPEKSDSIEDWSIDNLIKLSMRGI